MKAGLETGAWRNGVPMRAGRLIAEMRGGLDPCSSPAQLEGKKLVALHQLLHEARFRDPSGDHLSPAGPGILRLPLSAHRPFPKQDSALQCASLPRR